MSFILTFMMCITVFAFDKSVLPLSDVYVNYIHTSDGYWVVTCKDVYVDANGNFNGVPGTQVKFINSNKQSNDSSYFLDAKGFKSYVMTFDKSHIDASTYDVKDASGSVFFSPPILEVVRPNLIQMGGSLVSPILLKTCIIILAILLGVPLLVHLIRSLVH